MTMTSLLIILLTFAQDPVDDQARMKELITGLGSESLEDREGASRLLLRKWETWSDEALVLLNQAQSHANGDISSRAKVTLGRIQTRKKLGKELIKRAPSLDILLSEGSAESRMEALTYLGDLWKEGSVEEESLFTLVNIARDEKWTLSYGRLHRLVVNGGYRLYAHLLADRMDLKEKNALGQGIGAVGKFGLIEYEDKIIKHIEHPNQYVQFAVLKALGEIATTKYIDKLIERLNSGSGRIRQEAITALARAGGPEHADLLAQFMKDPKDTTFIQTFDALAIIGGPAQKKIIAPLMSHQTPTIQIRASALLCKWGDKDDLKLFYPLFEMDSEYHRARAIYDYGFLACRVLQGAARKAALEKLIPLDEDQSETVKVAVITARILLGMWTQAEIVEQLRALDPNTVEKFVTGEILEALEFRFNMESANLLDRKFTLPHDVFSAADFHLAMKAQGVEFKFAFDLPIRGRIPKGKIITPRQFANFCRRGIFRKAGTAQFFEGTTLKTDSKAQIFDRWIEQLETESKKPKEEEK